MKIAREILAKSPNLNADAFNFGPNSNQNYTVIQLIEEMQKYWPDSNWWYESELQETR